jgi:diamine N-acetyltransferase
MMSQPSCVPGEIPHRPQTLRDRDGATFAVREYESGDRTALESFYDAFSPKRGAQGLPPVGESRIAAWLDSILSTGLHLVAYRGAELIGHAFVVPTRRPGVGEYAVFLREDVRGRGIGGQLNGAVVEAARSAGYRGLWLTVEPRNRAAIGSYEKVGFRFIPETVFSIEAEMELSL